MSNEIQKDRRWLKSVIAASAEPLPNFPWMRATRRRPESLRDQEQVQPMTPAIAPRRITIAAR